MSSSDRTPASRRTIPIAASQDGAEGDTLCGSGESFALMVLGDSMAPEFNEGDVVIIEPDGLARDGSYVLAHVGGEFIFRRLHQRPSGWSLHALQEGHPVIEITDLGDVRGVVIQKTRPGRRREARRYVE